MSSSPVPLKTRRVGQRCTLNLSRAETSSRWCGVVVRRSQHTLKRWRESEWVYGKMPKDGEEEQLRRGRLLPF
ncbi:hypothetical protein TNCV_4312421 [Trichonephila clavipes]|nr:hypothetical protein TNCV_4312421 [Trichonephila clavipes]